MATVSYGLKITSAYHIFDETIKIYRKAVEYITDITLLSFDEISVIDTHEGYTKQSINYTELTGKTAKGGEDIYKSAIYYCRRDRAGQALDRRAMIMASQSLGHNRESVVGEHYLKLE